MGHGVAGVTCSRLPPFRPSNVFPATFFFPSRTLRVPLAHHFGVSLCRAPSQRKSWCRTSHLGDSSELGEDRTCPADSPPLPQWKWRLVIAYDGTKYAGWQYQQTPATVQSTVEKALTIVTKLGRRELGLVGASRTDTGVHAWGQVTHFVTPFPYDTLMEPHAALNGLLPPDIRVREISPALPEFHARFAAHSKIYHYKIYAAAVMDPFQRFYAYHCAFKLNGDAMREAAKYFIGRKDFSAFSNAQHNDRKLDPVKEIFRFDVIEMGDLLQLEVEGSGFLYKQVRNMVSLLIQVGKEALPPNIVPEILGTRDRRELAKVAATAPPHGLCLVSVNYSQEILESPPGSPPISFGRTHQLIKWQAGTLVYLQLDRNSHSNRGSYQAFHRVTPSRIRNDHQEANKSEKLTISLLTIAPKLLEVGLLLQRRHLSASTGNRVILPDGLRTSVLIADNT